MRIFISWSGGRSEHVAQALREFLPLVLHYADPWVSGVDIRAGERWTTEVGAELEAARFGIICVTTENIEAPWLLFEAGALGKSMDQALVCPYLLDVEFSQITGPLSQFQAKKAERESTLDLVRSINKVASEPVSDERLAKLFSKFWPDLKRILGSAPRADAKSKREPKPIAESIEELIGTVRQLEGRLGRLETSIARRDEADLAENLVAQRTSVGEQRRMVLDALVSSDQPLGVSDISDRTGLSRTESSESLHDLRILRKIERLAKGEGAERAVTFRPVEDW